ncbi:MAG TPA: Na+/H+ antiporter NhaC family protein, partial [Rhodothermales bacterium]|nr:Na+/H+ antiporter NhaC family protein [Rhodothermales bacterium]
MVPVAAATGTNPYLLIGAIIAAGVFGAHGCYYSDARVLVSAATEVDNVRHGQTQIPLVMITFVVTCLIYLVLGFMA